MNNQNESCCICFEENVPLECLGQCAHRLHRVCVEKQIKAECPLCRTPLTAKLDTFWPFRIMVSRAVLGPVIEHWYENGEDIRNFRKAGYLHREEHPDYDSENPDSDMDYPEDEDTD